MKETGANTRAAKPTLIFDLDGTITDPREGITKCYAHALESIGMPVPPMETLLSFIGPPVHDVFRDLLKTQDAAEIQGGVACYRARYTDIGLFENFVYEGIPESLASLRDEGYKLLVCTSKPWTFAERILKKFELRDFFGPVYGPELDGTRGHKVELLAHLLQLEKLVPSDCIMIGDRLHDANAAKANGTRSLGVLYGFGDEAELLAAGVHGLCKTPQELPSAIARLPQPLSLKPKPGDT